jgi:phosphoethanolamine N-methyltransferase
MSQEDEYHDTMVAMLELIWGEGFMAPGGAGNVARILQGLKTAGRRILDIGCGIGGPALVMTSHHGATVEGIDLEAPLVARARRLAQERGLQARCHFQVVTPGPLPFEDGAFDIVVSSGAVTQTEDTAALFAEALRVLKPGGWLSCYEWLRTEREYSAEMLHWFEMEGLTYAMRTFEQYRKLLTAAGFDSVTTSDGTDWYRTEARRELALLRGDLYPQLVASLGQAAADHFVENWRAMVAVIDSGEMKQGYLRGRRPDA